MRRHVHQRRPSSAANRRGAALVEFAVVAPVFMLLILGVIEIGNGLSVANTLTSGVREGGRLATMDWTGVVPPGMTPNEKVIADIRNFYIASGLPVNNITITITHAEGSSAGSEFDLSDPDNRDKRFRIEASLPYEDVNSWPVAFLQGVTLRGSMVMQAIYSGY